VIEVPRGHVQLVPGSLRLSSLKVRVGRRVASASGKVSLNRFRPTMLDLSVGGDLNFKLLELLFPERISSASGAAQVKLKITGPVQDPQFSGQLAVRRVEISPRGWGRMITIRRGSVEMTNYLVKTLTPLEGTYDEGVLRVQGNVRLDRWDLANIDLRITGLGIPQRQPRVYSAELNFNLQLLGDSKQLELHGNVDLVDVRYVRKFDLIRKAFIKPRVYEEEDPFWQGSRLLESLLLQLTVRSSGQMMVKNEYAQLSLSGAFRVEGTLAQPRIGGQVRVEEGKFSIPFLRGQYTISRGDILFNKRRPVDQAELSITGETLFMDHTGVDYQIKLTLEGPLNRIGIKMTSNPPLEQGQIWALLVTGRTTAQLRDQLKGAVDTGGGGNQAAGAADAQVKQLTGEILNQIMVDPLKKVTKLDLLRFEMGTESAQVKAGKRLGRYINLAGEAEVGLLGDSRAEGRLEFKMHDLLMLVGKLERLSTRLQTEDVDPSRGRIELKVRLPLR
jgi:autotransporter translocation and assembly factor TamB